MKKKKYLTEDGTKTGNFTSIPTCAVHSLVFKRYLPVPSTTYQFALGKASMLAKILHFYRDRRKEDIRYNLVIRGQISSENIWGKYNSRTFHTDKIDCFFYYFGKQGTYIFYTTTELWWDY